MDIDTKAMNEKSQKKLDAILDSLDGLCVDHRISILAEICRTQEKQIGMLREVIADDVVDTIASIHGQTQAHILEYRVVKNLLFAIMPRLGFDEEGTEVLVNGIAKKTLEEGFESFQLRSAEDLKREAEETVSDALKRAGEKS